MRLASGPSRSSRFGLPGGLARHRHATFEPQRGGVLHTRCRAQAVRGKGKDRREVSPGVQPARHGSCLICHEFASALRFAPVRSPVFRMPRREHAVDLAGRRVGDAQGTARACAPPRPRPQIAAACGDGYSAHPAQPPSCRPLCSLPIKLRRVWAECRNDAFAPAVDITNGHRSHRRRGRCIAKGETPSRVRAT